MSCFCTKKQSNESDFGDDEVEGNTVNEYEIFKPCKLNTLLYLRIITDRSCSNFIVEKRPFLPIFSAPSHSIMNSASAQNCRYPEKLQAFQRLMHTIISVLILEGAYFFIKHDRGGLMERDMAKREGLREKGGIMLKLWYPTSVGRKGML